MRNKAEAGEAVEKYADTVRRVCFMHLKNYHDVEDVFQDVFLKYVLHNGIFENDSHEKAWLIRVAINSCKDILKSFQRRRVVSFDDIDTEPLYVQCAYEENREIFDALLKLPQKYRDVTYLFYYEGYTAVEISKILKKNLNTIYTWLSRAKIELRDIMRGEHCD